MNWFEYQVQMLANIKNEREKLSKNQISREARQVTGMSQDSQEETLRS